MNSVKGNRWPDTVAPLTLAELPDGCVVNVITRVGGQIIYFQYRPAGGGRAPELSYGRAHISALKPFVLAGDVETDSKSPRE